MLCLVLEFNFDSPLRRRDDLVFGRALEIGKLVHRLFDDLQSLLDFFFRDDKGWRQTDDVLMGWFSLS